MNSRIIIFNILFLFLVSSINAQIIFEDGFEDDDLNTTHWGVTWWTPSGQLDQGIDPEIVTSPVRYGKHAVKIRAQHNWSGISDYSRTELTANRSDNGSHHTFFYPGKEYWIGFSVYIPNDWEIDNKSQEGIFQLHGNGNEDTPSLAFIIDGDEWFWSIRWQDEFEAPENPNDRVDLGRIKYEKGEWVDWVMHVKFSYSNNGDGFMQVWKNGKSLFSRKGPNCYNDGKKIRGPQTGIYKWDWATDHDYSAEMRIIYLDEYTVGGGDSEYDDVVPGHSTSIRNENKKSEDLILYPNPVDNSMEIKGLGNLKPSLIIIYNSCGKEVKSINYSFEDNAIINTKDLPSGVYTCKVLGKNKYLFGKFVVVH